MGAGDDDAEGGEEGILANNQAAISSTPTMPVAEPGFLRYGVRYRSTLPCLLAHHATPSSHLNLETVGPSSATLHRLCPDLFDPTLEA